MVRLSIIPSLTALWLFPRLRQLEAESIHIELVLEQRLADFSEGVDLAIRCGRGPWPGVRSRALWPETARPIAAPSLAAGLGRAAEPAEILMHPLLHDSNIGGWRRWLALGGHRYQTRMQDRRFEDYQLVIEACAQGLGIALARLPVAQPVLDTGRVVFVSEVVCDNEVAFHLVRPDEPLRPHAATVARRLLAAAGHDPTAIEAFLA